MNRLLRYMNILVTIRLSLAKSGPDLPLCPMNIQYFPQNLPMHCRMPQPSDTDTDSNKRHDVVGSASAYTPPPFQYQSPPLSKSPSPIHFPIPPGFPAPIFPPPPIGGPVPVMPAAPHKLPVIVMPFYAPDRSYDKTTTRPDGKKKRDRDRDRDRGRHTDYSSDDTDDSSERDSDSSGYWKPRRKPKRSGRRSGGFSSHSRRHHYHRHGKHGKKKDFLTPIIQYVTNDGYVIFEKEISKNEAKDWLKPSKSKIEERVEEVIDHDSDDNKVGSDNNDNKNVLDAEEKPFINLEDEEPTTEVQQVEETRSRNSKKSRKKRQKHEANETVKL